MLAAIGSTVGLGAAVVAAAVYDGDSSRDGGDGDSGGCHGGTREKSLMTMAQTMMMMMMMLVDDDDDDDDGDGDDICALNVFIRFQMVVTVICIPPVAAGWPKVMIPCNTQARSERTSLPLCALPKDQPGSPSTLTSCNNED